MNTISSITRRQQSDEEWRHPPCELSEAHTEVIPYKLRLYDCTSSLSLSSPTPSTQLSPAKGKISKSTYFVPFLERSDCPHNSVFFGPVGGGSVTPPKFSPEIWAGGGGQFFQLGLRCFLGVV